MRTEIRLHPWRILAIVVLAFGAFTASYAVHGYSLGGPTSDGGIAPVDVTPAVSSTSAPGSAASSTAASPQVRRHQVDLTAPTAAPASKPSGGDEPQPRPAAETSEPAQGDDTPEPSRSTAVATPSQRGTCGPLHDQRCE